MIDNIFNPFMNIPTVPYTTYYEFDKFKAISNNDENTFVVTNYYGLYTEGSNLPLLLKVAGVRQFQKSTTYYPQTVAVPFETVPEIPIGSVWVNGIPCKQYDFKTYHFSISNDDIFYLKDTESVDWGVYPNKIKSCFYFERNGITFIVPNILFFNCYYGASKEFSYRLLTENWDNLNEYLQLNYVNPTSKNRVVLPNNFVKLDSYLLGYLKDNTKTQQIVKRIRASISTRLVIGQKEMIYLPNLEIWHDEKIPIEFKGFTVSNNTVLCTEFTGIGYPSIHYDIDNIESVQTADDEEGNVIPIHAEHQRHAKEDELLNIVNNQVDNRETRIVHRYINDFGAKDRIKTYTIKVSSRKSDKRVNIPETQPVNFSAGNRICSGGETGSIRAYVGQGGENENPKDLNYLDELVQDMINNNIDFIPYLIDKNGTLIQSNDKTEYKTQLGVMNFPLIISILRLKYEDKDYVIIDCEPVDNYTASALIIEVPNERFFNGSIYFISKSNDEITLSTILASMKRNHGLPYSSKYSSFERLQKTIRIERVKHSNSSLVMRALAKIRN